MIRSPAQRIRGDERRVVLRAHQQIVGLLLVVELAMDHPPVTDRPGSTSRSRRRCTSQLYSRSASGDSRRAAPWPKFAFAPAPISLSCATSSPLRSAQFLVSVWLASGLSPVVQVVHREVVLPTLPLRTVRPSPVRSNVAPKRGATSAKSMMPGMPADVLAGTNRPAGATPGAIDPLRT